ncbi:serine/threonine protein kinase [Nitzschia inconspicua]|uniref:Serine/threonine-protein kinase RIO1 n=1 Tax=Nitzschia inconspicua TaxID=303405 RepID=A0A9K3L615_9STRA|nr:serine/threonine protein kinase [Nitzschia inconspicua]
MNQFEDAPEVAVQAYVEDDDDEIDDDGEDDDDFYFDDDEFDNPIGGGSSSRQSNKADTTDHFSLGKKMNFSHSVANTVSKMQELEVKKRTLHTSRDDRATTEQCLDPRTRLMLFKMLSNGMLDGIDGCLSTGKEANVYYAKAGKKATALTTTSQSQKHNQNGSADKIEEFAIKIYKTSILVFKDRDKYVSGEHRWRKGYCKSNPRKMVKVWAEKEMRNYRRIYAAGIPCPAPIFLKAHILVMEFLGSNGWPSPRLKDAGLNEKHMREAYIQTILILRHMYQRCKLVHGDFSEYNLLWHKNQVYVIDVSQSVETDHPAALDFLRKDASNVNEYFSKVGKLNVMTTRQLFEFITLVNPPSSDGGITASEEAAEMEQLERIMKDVEESYRQTSSQTEQERREQDQQNSVDEAVFMSSFLPRSLNQMADYDIRQLENGQVEESYAQAVAALTGNHEVVERFKSYKSGEGLVRSEVELDETDTENPVHSDGEGDSNQSVASESDDDDLDDDSEDDDSGEGEEGFCKVPKTNEELEMEKAELRASRKANKKAVKEAKAEKRQTKIKKKDKKRAIKKAKAGNSKNK